MSRHHSCALYLALLAVVAVLSGCQKPSKNEITSANSSAGKPALPTVSPQEAASMEAKLRQQKSGN